MEMQIGGYTVIVDDEDYGKVAHIKWHIYKPDIPKGRYYCRGGRANKLRLHRIIMGCTSKDKKIVDHINGNTLDNRKCNLRICTIRQNVTNMHKRKSNTSGYKGVTWQGNACKWKAQITVNYKCIYLGLFENPHDAYLAYCDASALYHGEYGRVN